jgi:nitrate/TMAO reductase-like tetraheme cytochrome c subunit
MISVSSLGVVCLICAACSIAILVAYLVRRPPLDFRWRMILLLGLGGFPAGSAITSTVSGMTATTEREFCGSCHTMDDYVADADDLGSQSLAARHGRNPFFGDRNCYVCHADYGMLGYPLTKLTGMKHVYMYYIAGWRSFTPEEARARIHIAKPYDNKNCRQCHSGTLADWSSVSEHVALEAELADNSVSCSSAGCHGYAHPFSKADGRAARGLPHSAVGSDQPDRPISSALPAAARRKIEEARAERDRGRERAAEELRREKEERAEAAKEAARARTGGADAGAPSKGAAPKGAPPKGVLPTGTPSKGAPAIEVQP